MARDYSSWRATDEEDAGFDRKPMDLSAEKARFGARVQRSIDQLEGRKGLQGGRDYSEHPGGYRLRLTHNGERVYMDARDEQTGYHPATTKEGLVAGLKGLLKDIKEGHFDDDLRNLWERAKDKVVGQPSRQAATPRGEGLGKKSRPLDPEWMARFKAKYGPAPSADHVPNSKGTRWITRAARERGEQAAATRASNR